MNFLQKSLNTVHAFAVTRRNGLLLLGCSLLFAWAVFHPQLKAGLWIADDHQILDFVSQVGHSLKGYWTIITHPSDFPLAGDSRLRPVYWPIRISEIFLWYDNGFGWHFARLLMITAFLGLISTGLYKLTSAPFAVLVIFIIVQLDSVAGVWTRLGNAEAYGAVGVAAIIWACASLMQSATQQSRATVTTLVVLNLGILLAVGSKENFFLFAAFLLITPCYVIWQKLRAPSIILTWMAAVAISVVMAKHLIKTLASKNKGEQSMFGSLFSQLIEGTFVLLPFLWFPLILFVVAVLVSAFLRSTRTTRPLKLDNILFVAVCGFLALCAISQPTFHNGAWPAKDIYSRYNFVGWFAPFLIGALSSAVIYRSVVVARVTNTPEQPSSAFKVAGLGMLCAAFLIYQHPVIYDQAVATYKRTNRTDQSLTAVTQMVAERKFDYLTIEVQTSRDYEASISTIIHLRHRGVQAPIFVRVKPETDPHNQQGLLNRLREFSDEGGRGFSPIADMDASSKNCLSLFFYVVQIDDTHCEKFTFVY